MERRKSSRSLTAPRSVDAQNIPPLPHITTLIGSGGQISWPKPTRPGDTLSVVSEIEEVNPSRSRPDRGMIRVRSETRNQRGETVQILLAKLVVPRRTPAALAT